MVDDGEHVMRDQGDTPVVARVGGEVALGERVGVEACFRERWIEEHERKDEHKRADLGRSLRERQRRKVRFSEECFVSGQTML